MRPTQTFRLGIALAFISLFSPRIGHSTGILLEPDNLTEVMVEIEDRYGDLLGISIGDVKSYLEQHLQNPYDESLGVPDPMLDFQDDDFLTFSWNPILDALGYTTGYLNLNNGTNNNYTTVSPTINFEIPNDRYLFIFSATSEFGQSKNYIIIEDKILALVINGDCECRSPQEPEIFNFDSTDLINLVPFQEDEFHDYYSGVLQFESSGYLIESKFALGLHGEDNSISWVTLPTNYSSDGTCMQNTSNGGTYLWGIDDSANAASPSGYAFRFQFDGTSMKVKALYDQYLGATLELTPCSHPFDDHGGALGGEEENDNGDGENDGKRLAAPQLEIFPNPTENEITLALDQTNTPNQILISNQMGQLVKVIDLNPSQKNRPTDQLTIDLSSFPAGPYFLQFDSANTRTNHKVIKF